MSSFTSFLLEDSNDDSLLQPIPFGKKNNNTNINNTQNKTSSIKSLFIGNGKNDDDDDDDVVIMESPIKEIHNLNENLNPGDDFHLNSSDSDIQIIEDQTNNKQSDGSNEEWLGLNDSLCHSTPMNMLYKNSKIKKKSTGKKALLSKIKNKNNFTSIKSKKVNKNLFTEDDEYKEKPVNQNLPLLINIQQKDALNHILICINSCLFDIGKTQLIQIFSQENLNYEINEENSEYCVTWKCLPQLEELIKEVNKNENYLLKCVNILQSSKLFDHLLILIPCNQLHDYLDLFLDSLTNSSDNTTNELFNMIKCCCEKHGIYNVTLVIWKLEKHLNMQQKLLDDSFRRRVKNLMSDPQKLDSKKKIKPRSNKYEITLDNIDIFLVDCKIKFLHKFHTNKQNCKLTVINIDNEQELAMTLFRYSRSLCEQIFRKIRKNNYNISFFTSEKLLSIDPKDEASQRALWHQQLLQFPNISADIAEAITIAYPTPKQLLNAIQYSSNPVRMLSEIKINDTNKRVGIELATKIHLFMTSDNPDQVLKTGNTASSNINND